MMRDVTAELSRLGAFGTILAIKLYRVEVDPAAVKVPVLPCLDHEAMLHQHVAQHVAAYLLEPNEQIHEVVSILRVDCCKSTRCRRLASSRTARSQLVEKLRSSISRQPDHDQASIVVAWRAPRGRSVPRPDHAARRADR